MRTFRWVLFLLLLLVLQTVIFPRLNLFGIYPDSFLVAVVVVAVTAESTPALLLAGFLGFLQDILSVGIYLNTMIKVMAGLVVANINREFVGDRGRLALGLTALISPAVVLLPSTLPPAILPIPNFIVSFILLCPIMFFTILCATILVHLQTTSTYLSVMYSSVFTKITITNRRKFFI